MADDQNTPPFALQAHAGFALRQRVWVTTKGWEFHHFIEGKGISPSEFFNCVDFVIEDANNPPTDVMDMHGRRPAGFLIFQDGPIKDVGINGVQVEHVVDALWQRLLVIGNANGGMDMETEKAVEALKSAGRWLEARRNRRAAAGTEGTAQMTAEDAPADEPTERMDGGGYEEEVTETHDQGSYVEDKPSEG